MADDLTDEDTISLQMTLIHAITLNVAQGRHHGLSTAEIFGAIWAAETYLERGAEDEDLEEAGEQAELLVERMECNLRKMGLDKPQTVRLQ